MRNWTASLASRFSSRTAFMTSWMQSLTPLLYHYRHSRFWLSLVVDPCENCYRRTKRQQRCDSYRWTKRRQRRVLLLVEPPRSPLKLENLVVDRLDAFVQVRTLLRIQGLNKALEAPCRHFRLYFPDAFGVQQTFLWYCLLYTSPSPRDKRQSRMPSSA